MNKYILGRLAALRTDRRAVTAIEYALIAALIAAVIVGGVTIVGSNAAATFNSVGNAISPSSSGNTSPGGGSSTPTPPSNNCSTGPCG